MWLDGADTNTIKMSSSNNVYQWNDKSGKGNNATQSSNNNQPKYSQGMRFYGNQWFETPISAVPGNNETLFVVFNTSNSIGALFAGTNFNTREIFVNNN